MTEKALIVGLELQGESATESMDELERLVETAGGEVVGRVIQKSGRVNPSTYIGSGKVEELKELAESMEIDIVVVNHELSGSQLRNLEEGIDKKIIDRTGLILDIFAARARTGESVLQVKLAQANYMLPRLTGYRNYLSRTGGGIGTRGPGEQKLETDRRHIRRQIDSIKRQLVKLSLNRDTKRKGRSSNEVSIVALVGYTNAGKSTLMNRVLKATNCADDKEVYADDRLFATLDTSHRRVELPGGKGIVLADTVGFVKDIPINLVEAFKSTLEEIKYADLLILVIDASSDNIDVQKTAMREVLDELGIDEVRILEIYNKMDLVCDEYMINRAIGTHDRMYISALNDDDIQRLLVELVRQLEQDYIEVELQVSYDMVYKLGSLLARHRPIERVEGENGMHFKFKLPENEISALKNMGLI